MLGHRGDGRLGVAVVVCSLRWLGFVPENLGELPEPALLALCDQLEADPRDLQGYGARAQTRTDQSAAARAHAEFRPFDEAEAQWLERWLVVRAMEHERPKALFTLACEQLRCRRVVRCSVDQLVRLIGAAREQAHQATFDALASQLAERRRRDRIDGLLRRRVTGRRRGSSGCARRRATTRPRRSWRSSRSSSYLKDLGAAAIDLSMLPPGRVRILADGPGAAGVGVARLVADRGAGGAVRVLAHILRRARRRADRPVLLGDPERRADRPRRGQEQREETARARDQRSSLAGTLARILLDAIDHGEDPVSRTLREVGEQRLREAVADPGALAVPIEQERRDALHRRHQHLAQFAPAVIAALDLTASRGYERLLQAVEHTNANRHLRLLPDAPLEVLPAAWRPWTLTIRGARCAPATKSRCGSWSGTRCGPAASIGRAATATATRPAG